MSADEARDEDWERPPRRRVPRGLVAGAFAFALAAAVAVAGRVSDDALGVHGDADAEADGAPDPRSTVEPVGEVSTLPEAPIGPRSRPVHVWTGTELIVWGGTNDPLYGPALDGPDDPPDSPAPDDPPDSPDDFAVPEDADGPLVPPTDGAAFDPATGRWRSLAAGPLSARVEPVAVWTGERMIIWGGWEAVFSEGDSTGVLSDGAAYLPHRDTWEPLPPAPLSPRILATAAWTGEEFLIFGGGTPPTGPTPGDSLVDGAAFDPETGTWRVLPDPPPQLEPSFVAEWVGDRLLVWDRWIVAAYVPATDRWEVIEPPAATTADSDIISIGGGSAVFVGMSLPGEARAFGVRYDVDDGWGAPVRTGPAHRGLRVTVAADDLVFLLPAPTFGAGGGPAHQPVVWDVRLDRWLALPAELTADREGAAVAWTGEELLVWGGHGAGKHHDDGRRWSWDGFAPADR